MRTAVQITSADAYRAHRSSGQSAQQRTRILEFIKARGGDWSIGEIAQALSLQKSTARYPLIRFPPRRAWTSSRSAGACRKCSAMSRSLPYRPEKHGYLPAAGKNVFGGLCDMRALPETSIRPVSNPEPVLPDTADCLRQAEPRAAGNDAGIHRAQAGQVSQGRNRKRAERYTCKVRNERIVSATTGTMYAFWHRCFGHARGRFKAERDARLWAMTYGYQFDGALRG